MRDKQQMKMKEEINREFLEMAPEALDALRDIISDPGINPIARVQAIGLVLDRGLGKPEENINIRNAEETAAEAYERLEEIFKEVRENQ